MFTVNNPEYIFTEVDFNEWKASYLVFQLEMGENGTLHIQGYVEMPKSVRASHFGFQAHWERAKGKPEQCYAYCTKVIFIFSYVNLILFMKIC